MSDANQIDMEIRSDSISAIQGQRNDYLRFCIKRRYITLLIVTLCGSSGMYFVPLPDGVHRLYLISPLVGALLMVAACMWPKLVAGIFERPYWYQDLMSYEQLNISKKALSLFHVLCTVTFGLVAVATFDYGVYQYREQNIGSYECLGIIGGMLSLYNMVINLVGQAILHSVIWYCDRQGERRLVMANNISTDSSASRNSSESQLG